MNLIDIVKNAPEGATHYGASKRGSFYYYKDINGQTYKFHSVKNGKPIGGWEQNWGNPCCESSPLPKIKTSYKKVEDVIWDLRPDFEAGELYIRTGDDYEKIGDLVTLSLALNTKTCFYRVDKIIDEREEFELKMIELINEYQALHHNPGQLGKFLYSKGCRFIG